MCERRQPYRIRQPVLLSRPSDTCQVVQTEIFLEKLRSGSCKVPASTQHLNLTPESVGMSEAELMTCVKAAFATNILHTESRIMSLLGEGFYTIGPSGEELLVCIRDSDVMCGCGVC